MHSIPGKYWLHAILWTLLSPCIALGMLLAYSIMFVSNVDGEFVEIGSLRFGDVLAGPVYFLFLSLVVIIQYWYVGLPLLYGINALHVVLARHIPYRSIRSIVNILVAGVAFMAVAVLVTMFLAKNNQQLE